MGSRDGEDNDVDDDYDEDNDDGDEDGGDDEDMVTTTARTSKKQK